MRFALALILLGSCAAPPRVATSQTAPRASATVIATPTSADPSATGRPTALASASPSPVRVTASPLITETPTAGDERLIASLVAFARAPRADTFTAIPFADNVLLGLGDKQLVERRSRDLAEADAWVLRLVPFR